MGILEILRRAADEDRRGGDRSGTEPADDRADMTPEQMEKLFLSLA
jgi:hypothetical protein